jgi:NAD(P)-dependent dehydrogenase (short-subunit alcohol dehydrogenase family)
MPTVLITGANRGLGLEFARQYAADGWRVLACARSTDAPALRQLVADQAGVTAHALDVADYAAVDQLAAELSGTPIDVLLNNAGVMGSARFGETDYAQWTHVLTVNALAPMKMAEAFVEHIATSEQKKIVTLTSKMGSIGDNTSGGYYAYRSSKAAANAVMKSMAADLAARGIIAVPIHPGWVRTDMGGASASLETVDSAAGMRKVIAALKPADSGRFLQYDGKEIAW